ncbi:MAG: hypothetical protein IPG56_09935 [Caulobacteraceae bacterium]|nr:hypothetical protein [Caulobacteraceae bacterium]
MVRLHRAGEIDDETLHDLEHDLDLEELGAIASKVQRAKLAPFCACAVSAWREGL